MHTPPRFGRSLLPLWSLDPAATYLNHGTVGATPLAVLAAQAALRDEIERHPARMLLREITPIGVQGQPGGAGPDGRPRQRLRAAAAAVAPWLGVTGDDLVFVANATTGANAVLSSFRLAAGDEVLVTNRTYGGVARAAAHHAARAGATVCTTALPFPGADAAALVAAVEAALTPRTRLAVLDHVSPETALLMPLAEMAAVCRARGVAVLADGAHAPGAVPVDIPSLGVDFYAANLHKWAFAPRSCAVLWAAPARRDDLHPTVTSWGSGLGWHAEFDWVGTSDPTPYLCAPAGLAFIDEALGGREALWAHNHGLAWRSAERLCERWNLPWLTPRRMVGSMVSVPLPPALGHGAAAATALKDWLLFEHSIEAQILAIDEALWWRISAQAYNDDEDIERVASVIDSRLRGG
ncbi:aminotransferase class V-fold PLP-dependent enzyme [Ideonella sp. YS5]|uniref:aminotransferase class V-fold PLP-dependent enzyme n=1 Tax=Ideonella sp. YS5 TaxID=3453714 RepID=UPI003EEAAD52